MRSTKYNEFNFANFYLKPLARKYESKGMSKEPALKAAESTITYFFDEGRKKSFTKRQDRIRLKGLTAMYLVLISGYTIASPTLKDVALIPAMAAVAALSIVTALGVHRAAERSVEKSRPTEDPSRIHQPNARGDKFAFQMAARLVAGQGVAPERTDGLSWSFRRSLVSPKQQ